MSRIHRELLKQQLMNYDYSNTPVDKSILVELDEPQITVSTEGPEGFTHWRCSGGSLGNTASGAKSDENVIDFKIDILGSNASIEGRTLREIGIFSGAATTTPNVSANTMLLRIPFDAIGPFSSSEEIEFFIAVEIEWQAQDTIIAGF